MGVARIRFGWILGLGLGLCLGGCGVRELSPPPPVPDHLEHPDYVIGVRDGLRLRVWQNRELGVDVTVRMDGKISVPLLDDV